MNDFPCIAEQNATQNVSRATQKSLIATQYLHSACTKYALSNALLSKIAG